MQDRRVKREIWLSAAAILSGFAGSVRQPVPAFTPFRLAIKARFVRAGGDLAVPGNGSAHECGFAARDPVKLLLYLRGHETIRGGNEAIFPSRRKSLETAARYPCAAQQ
jgi:hypothetical protein